MLDRPFLLLTTVTDLVGILPRPTGSPSITDERIIALLIAGTLLVSIILIGLFLFYSRNRSSEVIKQMLVEAIEQRRFDERISDLDHLEEQLKYEQGEFARLQIELHAEEGKEEKSERANAVAQKRQDISRLQSQLRAERERLRTAAHAFAQSVVADAIPSSLNIGNFSRGVFLLEFTTVTVIVMSVIILALLGVLNGDQLSPILAAVAGYILGRSARQQERESEG